MAVTPFRHLDFADHEPVTKEKLDQFQSNIQWLVENSPTTLYINNSGVAAVDSLIIVAGRVKLQTSYGTASTSVYFNGAFDSTTNPVVTTGVGSEGYKHVWVIVNGIGTSVLPDARGFDATVKTTEPLNANPVVYLNWIAIGKRSPTYDSI